MTSEIDKLKHFHIEDYSGIYFTDELNAGEEFLYTTNGTCQNRRKSDVFKEPNGSIHYNGAFTKRATSRYSFATKEWTENKNPICWSGGFVGNLGLVKKLWKKYTEAIYKYRTNTGKMTASDYTHLFGYLNPYYRSAYNIPKRRK